MFAFDGRSIGFSRGGGSDFVEQREVEKICDFGSGAAVDFMSPVGPLGDGVSR